jgi:RNA-splicing ligase RtcB
MAQIITGRDLMESGMAPGNWFGRAIAEANRILSDGGSKDSALAAARVFEPGPALALQAAGDVTIHANIRAENELEQDNVDRVKETMRALSRTPVVRAGAIMPDACPAGPLGTIPVGGVIASEAIHPGMHSADICCSMAISVMPGVSPKELLDAVQSVTHFGPGGRAVDRQVQPSADVMAAFQGNEFLRGLRDPAVAHFATQGDGNHFAYVGSMKSTGETVLVTHHGSRAPGALLYKKGMAVAERFRQKLSSETLKGNAWIPADTKEGEDYWEALQIVRAWTRENHYAIHDMAASVVSGRVADRFWNEHNFVFRKSDGLFYHGKGATPAFDGWASDATDLTIIPLNMAEPILIVRGSNADNGLGFSPHGAGRNFSRSQHKRMLDGRPDSEVFAEETKGLDARFFSGVTDVSELPSAYKNAKAVRAQIAEYGLAEVVDEVVPYGSIMAGDWEQTAPWRRKRDAKREAARA